MDCHRFAGIPAKLGVQFNVLNFLNLRKERQPRPQVGERIAEHGFPVGERVTYDIAKLTHVTGWTAFARS